MNGQIRQVGSAVYLNGRSWKQSHESPQYGSPATDLHDLSPAPAMRGGQMHQVFSRVLLSCTCVDDYHTLTQVEPCLPKNIYTQRNDRYTKRNIVFNLKVISSSYPFVFLKPRKSENCKKKKKKNLISNVIHLYGRLAGWFKWVKNSCRGQSAGEVVLSWRRQGWVEGEVIKWFHRNSYLQEK